VQAEKLTRLRATIDKFKQEARIEKPSEQLIGKIKSTMEQIDSQIGQLKEDSLSTLQSLADEEKLVSREVEAYENKIASWLNGTDVGNLVGTSSKRKIVTPNDKYANSELLPQVIEFDVGFLKKNNIKTFNYRPISSFILFYLIEIPAK
jgi:hypothetical protein